MGEKEKRGEEKKKREIVVFRGVFGSTHKPNGAFPLIVTSLGFFSPPFGKEKWSLLSADTAHCSPPA